MKKYTGKGVYGAVAIGKISIFKRQEVSVKRERIEDTEAQKQRVEAAKALAGIMNNLCFGELILHQLLECLGSRQIAAIIDQHLAAFVAQLLHPLKNLGNSTLFATNLIQHLQSTHIAGLANSANAQNTCDFCHHRADTAIVC